MAKRREAGALTQWWLECESTQTSAYPTTKQIPFLVSALEKPFYWSLSYISVHCLSVGKSQKPEAAEIATVREVGEHMIYT